MRYLPFVLVAALAAGIAGCLPVASVHPFVGANDAVEVPEIVGEWADANTTLRIALESDSVYTVSSPDSTDVPSRLRVRFTRVGGRLFADMTAHPRGIPGGDPQPWLWPMHTAFRVDVTGDSLRLAFLDDDWVKGALDRHQVKARHERPDGDVLLTEGTPGLRAMLKKLANVDAAFDTTAKFMRRR